MEKFVIRKTREVKETEKLTEFWLELDRNGDLDLMVQGPNNGSPYYLLTISAEFGTLCRHRSCQTVDNIKTDKSGRIKLIEE